MPPLKEVRNRIKSVRNISQITRALEAVSASRVRRAQARVLASRAFAEKAWEILVNLQSAAGVSHPLLTARPEVKKVMIILLSSDRGLAGSYNTNVIRVAERFEDRIGKPSEYITVGRKGRDTMIRQRSNVIAEFSDIPAEPTIETIAPIVQMATNAFLSGEVDEVVIAYTDFVNVLTQRPLVRVWLPLSTDAHTNRVASDLVAEMPAVSAGATAYDYEPNAAAVLDSIVPRFTELQMYQALLESQASEHASRMAAMRNATSNASQLVGELTLDYNKARQAAITTEILDIVGGANALQSSIDKLASAILVELVPQNVSKPVTNMGGAQKMAQASGQSDNLTRIEGIGPKISQVLKGAGVQTFAELALKTTDELHEILKAAGISLSPSLPTWAQQAALARNGDWDALKILQNDLVAGRKA